MNTVAVGCDYYEYYWQRYDNRKEFLSSVAYILAGGPEAPIDEILSYLVLYLFILFIFIFFIFIFISSLSCLF